MTDATFLIVVLPAEGIFPRYHQPRSSALFLQGGRGKQHVLRGEQEQSHRALDGRVSESQIRPCGRCDVRADAASEQCLAPIGGRDLKLPRHIGGAVGSLPVLRQVQGAVSGLLREL